MDSQASAPNTPQAPSVGDQINSYISSLPSLVSASNQYSPQIAAQSTQMTAQNAPMLAQIQQSLYPQLTALQNNIASTASSNITNGMPAAMAAQYQDQFKSQVGDQNSAGIGADYVSRAMQAQQQSYAQNWAQIGNAATGQNPLYNVNGYQAPNIAAAYSPTSALTYGAQTYGSYASSYANMYGANAGITNSNNNLYQQYATMGLKGVGAAGSGPTGMATAAGG